MLGEGELELLKVMADGRLYGLKALAGAAAQRDWEAAGRLARLAELGLVEILEVRKAGRGGLERAKAYRITPEGLKAVGAQPAEPSPAARAEPSGAAQLAVQLGERELRLLKLMADGALWRREALRAALAAEGAGEVAGPLGRLVELGLVEALELRTALRRQGGFASVPVYRITPQGLALLERGKRAEELRPRDLQQRLPPRAGAPAPQRERRLEGLDHRALELLRAMADERLYTLGALIGTTGWHEETVKRRLERLIELKLVEVLELRRVEWKRGELGSVKVYRITPVGLKAIRRVVQLPAVPPSGAASERPSGEGGAVGRAEGRRRAWDLQLLRIMSDRKLWGFRALCFALARAAGGSASSGSRRRLVKRCLRRLAEHGEVEALELCTAAREGGKRAVIRVYRITERGLETLVRETGSVPPPPPPPAPRAQLPRDPAVLLKLMEDGSLWTLGALAKATGWERTTVKRYLQRLAGLEAVELRVASWKRRTVATVYVYRLKRGGAAGPRAPSGREAQLQAPERSGRPDLDILLAMSDGALWTMGALKVATHYHKAAVKLHLERLTELGFVEAVEVRMARRKGFGFAVARVYRITQKGLEALESGQLPPLAAPPRGRLEPPEDGDPMRLALWVLEWSAQAARMLLHLYARGEDSWSGVLRAAKGYRYKHGGGGQVARLLRLRELGLVEWEIVSPDRAGGAKRLVRLTEKGREVARAILELTTLPLGREGAPETSGERPPPERIAAAIPTTWEPPEDGDPLRLAIWVVNWSAAASRILLHLRARAGYEDTWYRVAAAAGGYRYEQGSKVLGAILLRLRELGLVEWELVSPERSANLPARSKRIVKLTDRGREVADAILKLAALLREERAESF
ncbi:MAG: hypothetical protein LM580_01265 [Thermofilum sp.]|nr:hypothetical protein [Thermofilum sp.]